MSTARKLRTPITKYSPLDNSFSASIDKSEPIDFQATFKKVIYPQEGEPPRWTIEARYRDSTTNQIQSIRIIFLKTPENNKPVLANENLRILYSNTAEDPPSEYSTSAATTAIDFDSAAGSVSGNISATVSDGLETPKTHELTIAFNLIAENWVKRIK
ncbi:MULTISPECIES: hypothetical protein [unclassified Pseudomonas]|jgi:hypothetical protein|uniref:hypothetical protein n=1 Tax=unclassified Pseudomonas TaxID=196821 RepID=UPI001032F089|nr:MULTISPECIES: hypothetical protein [unclassified Pseudomonas]MBR7197928.1 hypothetical protein [Pseudomonas sp. 14A]